MSTRSSEQEIVLPLRVTLVSPPSGVTFCVQGKGEQRFSRTRSTAADLVFEFAVRVAGFEPVRLLGDVTQGPPAARFVYICSGTYAGDAATHWARRAKVPLAAITRELIEGGKPGLRLSASIDGKAKDGGPACASVKLLGSGWRWMR